MNSFSGGNAHQAPPSTGTPIKTKSSCCATTRILCSYSSFFSQTKSGSVTCPILPLSLSNPQNFSSGAAPKFRVEPLAIDRNSPEFCQVRPCRNFVFWSPSLPFTSQFQSSPCALQKIRIITRVLRRHQDHVHIRAFEVLKFVSLSTSFPSAS